MPPTLERAGLYLDCLDHALINLRSISRSLAYCFHLYLTTEWFHLTSRILTSPLHPFSDAPNTSPSINNPVAHSKYVFNTIARSNHHLHLLYQRGNGWAVHRTRWQPIVADAVSPLSHAFKFYSDRYHQLCFVAGPLSQPGRCVQA